MLWMEGDYDGERNGEVFVEVERVFWGDFCWMGVEYKSKGDSCRVVVVTR